MGKSKKYKKDKKSHSKKKHKHKKERKDKPPKEKKEKQEEDNDNFAIPLELMNHKSHAPETPEEFQRRSSSMRREVDPTTGRIRLIRGDSEVMEEIVSKDRHATINKAATESDGKYFQEQTIGKKTLH